MSLFITIIDVTLWEVGMKELSVDFRRKSRACENKKIGYLLYKKEDTMKRYEVTMGEITRYKVIQRWLNAWMFFVPSYYLSEK